MDIQGMYQFTNRLNTQRYNNEISHQAWAITIDCIKQTLASAGYTWDDMIAAGQ